MIEATIRSTDWRMRVIPFAAKVSAEAERDYWRRQGYSARIRLHRGVYNVVVMP